MQPHPALAQSRSLCNHRMVKCDVACYTGSPRRFRPSNCCWLWWRCWGWRCGRQRRDRRLRSCRDGCRLLRSWIWRLSRRDQRSLLALSSCLQRHRRRWLVGWSSLLCHGAHHRFRFWHPLSYRHQCTCIPVSICTYLGLGIEENHPMIRSYCTWETWGPWNVSAPKGSPTTFFCALALNASINLS